MAFVQFLKIAITEVNIRIIKFKNIFVAIAFQLFGILLQLKHIRYMQIQFVYKMTCKRKTISIYFSA